MSRPRKPFGSSQPGRLPATMMKVLAAELSDPARLRRGKQYAKDGSVLDIIVEPGVVTCEIQGSRATPYVASLEVTAGDGMPLRRDLHHQCTCPDDDDWADRACKHVVATMFVFADELLIEPDLLDVWRANERVERPGARERAGSVEPDRLTAGDDADDAPTSGASHGAPRGRRRHLELVRDGIERGRAERIRHEVAEVDEPPEDPLADHLAAPAGAALPDVSGLERVELPLPRRPDLAAALRDALAHARLDWD